MMFSKLAVCFGTLAMAAASAAAKYDVTFFQQSVIGSTELKPGDYRIEVDGDKATIKAGKKTVEAPVKIETASEKYPKTIVKYTVEAGKNRILEIRVAGTKTALIFGTEANLN